MVRDGPSFVVAFLLPMTVVLYKWLEQCYKMSVHDGQFYQRLISGKLFMFSSFHLLAKSLLLQLFD